MATKKKLLEAAAGAAGGAGGLNVESLFSTYLYEGNSGGQVIENGVNLGQSNSGGAAKFNNNNTIDVADSTDFAFGGGDWTVEAFAYPFTNDDFVVAGWGEDSSNRFDFGWQQSTFPRIRIGENGVQYEANASTSYDISNYLGTWVHLAAVRNGNTVTLYLNGTSVASVSYSEAGFPTPSTAGIGIGSRWYTTRTSLTNPANGYISNFRIVKGTAVYTSNFTVPTSALTAITNTSLLCLQGDSPLSDNSGNSHTLTQNQYNTADVKASTFGPFDAADAGEGGLVWIKDRDSSSNSHMLYDTERGVQYAIKSNTTDANQFRSQGLTAFNSNGFSLGTLSAENSSGNSKASWTFRKAPQFFDVVTYTGTGVARTVSHNLGSVPAMIIVKRTDSATSWNVYHRGLNGGTNPHQYGINLNTTGAEFASSGYWNNTAPTSTEFTVGTSGNANASGGTYVAYLFAHNNGDGEFGPTADQDIIKCGSYTGNGSSTGPEIDLGFEPQWLLFKDTTNANDWIIIDNMRAMVVDNDLANADAYLRPNSINLEGASTLVEPTPTGFKVQNNGWTNVSGANIIYIAIRRGPMAVPTSATDVYNPVAYSGDGLSNRLISSGTGVVDFAIFSERNAGSGSGYIHGLVDRMRGTKELRSSTTIAEISSSSFPNFDSNEGLFVNNINIYNHASGSVVANMWKRAPNYFDVVAYTGALGADTISHNLGVVPEMIWVKNRVRGTSIPARGNWNVYHSSVSNGYLILNDGSALATSDAASKFGNGSTVVAPTATSFTVADDYTVGRNGDTYIAYLFASLDGVSKVGSYTGNGSSLNVDCGFSSGARFVLIKRSDSSGDWNFYDSARGIVAGNDSRLSLNTTDTEDTSNDRVDAYSSGFTVNYIATGTSDSNISGATYIFYAIA